MHRAPFFDSSQLLLLNRSRSARRHCVGRAPAHQILPHKQSGVARRDGHHLHCRGCRLHCRRVEHQPAGRTAGVQDEAASAAFGPRTRAWVGSRRCPLVPNDAAGAVAQEEPAELIGSQLVLREDLPSRDAESIGQRGVPSRGASGGCSVCSSSARWL
eukprot:scaffold9021_cov118-Isochrysis_galbana.AAC.12